MGTFKIHGFRVSQRKENKLWYIFFDHNTKRSLKTKDKATAKKRAELAVEKYFQKKIVSLKQARKKPISEYLEEYLERKNYDSPGSRRAYVTAVNMFIDFIGDKPMRMVTSDDIEQFKRLHRQSRMGAGKGKVEKVSINTYLVRLKALFRQARNDGIIESVPVFNMYKLPKRLPVILEKEDKDRVLEYIKEQDHRFYCVCKFALYTGCRRSEIISARWENFKGFTIKVFGKGAKERTVPLVPQAKEAMGEPKKDGAIFWQAHPDTYSHYFKKYARACGVENVNFHKMRHTAATEMLEAGVNINVVQEVLGHTDIAVTKLYTHVMEKFMLDEMGKFGG